MQVLRILFATAFTFLTALALGKTVLKLLRAKLYRSEELFLGFVLGAACLSTGVFLLGVFSLVCTWVFLTLGSAAIAAAFVSGAFRFTSDRLPAPPRPWLMLFVCVFALFAFLDLGNALAPEASADGPMFHVALPALYLREHRIPPVTTNLHTSFSQGMEMLFLFAFSFGRHSAAAMTHLLFTLLLPWGMLSFARRIGSPVAGVVGGLLVFLSPMVAQDGSIAYVDVGLATVVFSAFYFVQIWRSAPDTRLLLPAGLLAGFAYGIKYTAFLAAVYALGVVAFELWRSRKPLWIPCTALILSTAATVAPWMIKNAIVTGNPVLPFFNRIIRNPTMYASTEADYRYNMGSLHGVPLWREPYEVTTRGGATQGFLGPIFLVVAPLALLAFRSAAGRQLLLAAALLALPFSLYTVARILLPALPFVSLAFGLAVASRPQTALAVILLHALLSWPAEIPKYASRFATRPAFPDWRAALRLTPEPQYLKAHIDEYGLEVLIESKVPPGERVFSFRGLALAYHSRDTLAEWQSAFGVRLGESLRAATQGALQPVRHFEFHFEPRAVQKIRLLQTAGRGASQWSVSEFRVFHSGSELPRRPEWRLEAFPNPWDVQLAFDNNPLTRWATREPPRPGMFIGINLAAAQTIDQVTAECTPDQAETRMTLEYENSPGQWLVLSSQPKVTDVPMPGRLRRAAVENLERQGIRWLAIYDLDPGARDFRTRQAQWGITRAGTAGRYTLYRLD